jgi:hypothetical protein
MPFPSEETTPPVTKIKRDIELPSDIYRPQDVWPGWRYRLTRGPILLNLILGHARIEGQFF